MAQPSQVPVRFPSGLSFDYPWGPLANMGAINPLFYMMWADDFMVKESTYTTTATGNGTAANAAGTGGTLLFTTNSAAPAGTDIVSIQLPAASFAMTAGKKAFGLFRIKLSSASAAEFRVGFLQTTVTPFTATDGIFFDKVTGSLTNLNLISTVGSTATTTAVPTGAYTLANNTYLDMGFYVDRAGTINVFVGAQLVGWLPQSGTGSSVGVRGSAVSVTPTLTTANLNFTMAVRSGAAASSTMTADFGLIAVER
jgi:hypothetical protein